MEKRPADEGCLRGGFVHIKFQRLRYLGISGFGLINSIQFRCPIIYSLDSSGVAIC